MNLGEVARVALQNVGRSWQGGDLFLSRVFVYDAAADSEVERWLNRNDRERDTHVRRGFVAGKANRRQKVVDVKLAVDAMMGASRSTYDAAILVTGDGDFAPLADAIGELGPLVAACSFKDKLSDELRRAVDRVGYLPDDPAAWAGWKLPADPT